MDFSEIRRELTAASASVTPRERPPASPKRTPEPHEGDTYDALLDYDSDTYEYDYDYRRKRVAGAHKYKPVQFVYAGKSSQPSDEEVQREWELWMAERRRRASAEGPLVFNDPRPSYAGLGSVKEFYTYRRDQTTSSANESSAA